VIKTRWSPAAGSVENTFDDILIEASRSAPKDKMRKIENWDLKNLSNFNEKYLSGFQTESYTVNLEDAYEAAKIKIQPHIQWMIRNDIGGDRQQIHQMSTEYSDVKFKQILIPVWLSAYRYKGKLFQFLVNGRTGKVAGDRPYSVLKIISTVVLVAVIIALVVIFTK